MIVWYTASVTATPLPNLNLTAPALHRERTGAAPRGAIALTDDAISALPRPNRGRVWHRDSSPGGLAVMLTPTCVGWYWLGVSLRIGLGRWPAMSASAARLAALSVAAKQATGGDVLEERRAQRERRATAKVEATKPAAPTLNEVWNRWQIERAPQLRQATVATYDLRWRIGLSAFGSQRLDAIGSPAVAELFNRVAREHGRVTANRLRTLGRLLHRWACVRWHLSLPEPWVAVRPFEESPRARVPNCDELQRILCATDQAPPTPRDVMRLLLFTGQRIGVVRTARWEDFDLDAGIWRLPAYRAKGRRSATIPLVSEAVAMLVQRAWPREHPEWVFPGGSHRGHFGCIRQTWRTTCKRAGVEGVNRHDIRRGLAVALSTAGVALPVVSRLLAHSSVTITATHYVALRPADLRPAMDTYARIISPPSV
jgi:integrase